MKKIAVITFIFLLIFSTAIIKNSTKKIEDEIFAVKENLRVFLETGERKIDKWYTACGYEEIFFEQNEEMFININSKDDIEKNRSLIDRFYG